MRTKSLERVAVMTSRSQTPISFRWKGRTHRIDAIERIWRDSAGRSDGPRLYRIRSRQHAFLLRYDRRLQYWSLVRSPLRLRVGLVLTGLANRIAA